MSTSAQIDANRANAKHSTGPKTEAGKAAVSQNNFRHGFAGAFVVLPDESKEQYEALLVALAEEHQPATTTERILVEKMAQHHWTTQRALLFETMAFGEDLLATVALLTRYRTSHERGFRNALADLLKLRSERRKAEIGFESLEQKKAQEVRRDAAESRKQELHKRAILMGEGQLTHRQALTSNAEMNELAKESRDEAKKAA